MPKMVTTDDTQIVGAVTELDVGGYGPNSGQLEFSITPTDGDPPQTFVVLMDSENRVFAAMTTLLATAYVHKITVQVTYMPIAGGAPVASNVKLLAAT